MSNNESISDFLAEQRDAAPEALQPLILGFEDMWERKLWHQLTDSLAEFFGHPASGPQRLAFYNVFVLKFAEKINQLKLVGLALAAAKECEGKQERLQFLEAVAKRVDKINSQDARVYASVEVARVKLDVGDLEGARKDLDEAERTLDSFDSVETIVHAAFYDTNADYYDRKQDYAAYYRNALLYLACVDLSSMTAQERHARAWRLAIAALVSNSIYNFGELLLHPILEDLAPSQDAAAPSTDDAWLRQLLVAFNHGNLQAYDALADRIANHKILGQHRRHLVQKVHLATLTEAVFRRPPHDRSLSFADLSQDTRIPLAEVEHLIMKALSLGLVRGTIDQVDAIAHITWVQPKVLDMSQIASMRERLLDWDSSVNKLGNWIEAAGKDVWAA